MGTESLDVNLVGESVARSDNKGKECRILGGPPREENTGALRIVGVEKSERSIALSCLTYVRKATTCSFKNNCFLRATHWWTSAKPRGEESLSSMIRYGVCKCAKSSLMAYFLLLHFSTSMLPPPPIPHIPEPCLCHCWCRPILKQTE